ETSLRSGSQLPRAAIVNAIIPALRNLVPAARIGMAIEIEGHLVAPVACADEVARMPQTMGLAKIREQRLGGAGREAAVQKGATARELNCAAAGRRVGDRLRPAGDRGIARIAARLADGQQLPRMLAHDLPQF